MPTAIRDLDLPVPTTVAPLASTDEAVRLLRERDIRQVVAVDGEEFSGLVCDLDLLESVALLLKAEREHLEGTVETDEVLVADVMDADTPLLGPETPLIETAHMLLDEKRTALPVLQDGRVTGVVSDEAMIGLYARSRGRGEPGPHAEAVLNHGSRATRTVRPTDTLRTACARLVRGRVRHIPVLERDRFVGFISDRDIARIIAETGVEWPDRTVADVGPAKVPVLRPRDSLARAAELMRSQRLMALPITSRDGLLVSLLTATDLLNALVESQTVPA